MQHYDVLVVGAGPAGSTAALNLAPLRRVALVEARTEGPRRIGESLLPAARRLLGDMGILDSFQAQAHSPYYGNRSTWGSSRWNETDFLRDPDGHGWHLDRPRFEAWLRHTAVERGSALFAPARLEAIERSGDSWKVVLATESGNVSIAADIVIDATGRGAHVARRLGASRRTQDRLVSGWVCQEVTRKQTGETGGYGVGFTHIQATHDGWWYTAPIPGNRRILAFHTDSDLPAARLATQPAALFTNAPADGEFGEILGLMTSSKDAKTSAKASAEHGVTPASSSVLQPFAGPGWFAAGDAAMTFDPLSGQGLLNALFTGLAAAEAADRQLQGCDDALPGYLQTLADIEMAYRRHLTTWYQAEGRWPSAPFWERRPYAGKPGSR
ncbi:MAG: FAD-dependent monooxygenase [Terriglobales bacterium]